MTFSDGLTLDRKEVQLCGFGPITDVLYKFARSLLPLQLDETEISLLCGICIICPGEKILNLSYVCHKLLMLFSAQTLIQIKN